jgi:small nuclear ribonucleoprotein (snRNP)-like protein
LHASIETSTLPGPKVAVAVAVAAAAAAAAGGTARTADSAAFFLLDAALAPALALAGGFLSSTAAAAGAAVAPLPDDPPFPLGLLRVEIAMVSLLSFPFLLNWAPTRRAKVPLNGSFPTAALSSLQIHGERKMLYCKVWTRDTKIQHKQKSKSTMDDPAASREKDPPRGPPPPGASSSSAPSTANRTGIKNNKKSSAASFRSLGRMLQYLDQQIVTVELKNGIRYTGMLDSEGCDDNFNVTLRDVCTDVPHHRSSKKKDSRRRPGSLSHHPPPHRQPTDRRDPAEPPSSSSHHPPPPPPPPPSPTSNFTDTSSHGVLLSVLQVRGSTVRYILLGDLDLTRLVASGLERERRAKAAHQRVALQPKKKNQDPPS